MSLPMKSFSPDFFTALYNGDRCKILCILKRLLVI